MAGPAGPEGKEGPTGKEGKEGKEGPAGREGPPGLGSVTVFTAPVTVPPGSPGVPASVTCGNGDERAVSGGWRFGGSGPSAFVNAPAPSGNGWEFDFSNSQPIPYGGFVYVTCVSP